MLKKITVNQVRLGMYLQALEGPWMDHPFWKTRFVIGSTADLVRLQQSAVAECWIDLTKGLGAPVGAVLGKIDGETEVTLSPSTVSASS